MCHLEVDKYISTSVRAGVCDVVHQVIAPFPVDDSLQEDWKLEDGGIQIHATVSFMQKKEAW